MVRIVITIGIVIIFLSGCSSMSAMAQPGLPGNTQDLFWCAAFDPISNTVYAIDYDMVLGDWEINLINNDALPINWRPQQHGWAIDNEGRGYYAYTTTLGNIAIMANNTNNYQLDATWALAFQLTTYTPYLNFDLESRDDWIYGLTYNTVTTPNNLCSFRYDTANGIFGELILLNPIDPLTIFTMTLDDTLMGLIHYTYYILDYEAPGWNYLYYDQVQPFGLNATLAPEIVTPGGISTPRDWCMILSDNDNYLWVFETDEADMIYIYEYYKHFGFGTQWNYGSGPSRSSCWWKNAWAACHRPPDNTIHFVAISFIDNGATGDYYLCYNRRTANDWYLDAFIRPEFIIIDTWTLNSSDYGNQLYRASPQITASPSGIIIWNVEYDPGISGGDIHNYFLSPELYNDGDNPLSWDETEDVDSTDLDFWYLDAKEYLGW